MNPLDASPYIPSGYEACGVLLNPTNKCNSMNDMLTYNCTCSIGYTRDLSLPYDNCLKQKDGCDTRLCLHGECISSKVRFIIYLFIYFIEISSTIPFITS